MRILVTSDGLDTLKRAAEYTTFVADPDRTVISLMGLCAGERECEAERRQLELVRDILREELSCPVETFLRCGEAVAQILNEIEQEDYDLVVLGIHLRRRWSHLRPKFVARHVASRIRIPLLIVFPEWRRFRRILVCSGGGRKDLSVVRAAGRLAKRTEADVTVLHVMSQVPISSDAQIEDLDRSADELIKRDTREGVHLERMLTELAHLGLRADKCDAKVRYGLVVDEIVRESEEGYDLVVVGAHHVSSERSWHELRELIQENVAERVILEAQRPVLIIPPVESGE